MDIIDKVLSLLISATIIALGNWIVVGTVTKHSSFVWTQLALFPLLTGIISFYDSLKVTPDQLSLVPVFPALSGPGLHSNLIEHGARTSEGRMKVLIYVDTRKQVGDRDHLRVFAGEDAAETWLQENDPEGVVFEYEVME
jgi:hypothetical protein